MIPDVSVLENDDLRVGISHGTGALVSFHDKHLEWDVIGRPELGLSFRLLVPLPTRRNNPVHGIDQEPPSVAATGDSVDLEWESVVSAHGGRHPITVHQRYSIEGRALRVDTVIDNRSELIVENVYSPYVADIRPPAESATLASIRHDYGAGMVQQLWPRFDNTRGYYGVDVPTQLAEKIAPSNYGTPVSPFTLMQSENSGLYVGVASNSTELVVWVNELWPGYADSLESRVPESREIGGKPVNLQFSPVHVPYIAAGERRELTPIVLQAYDGDWHRGADIYRTWRDSWLVPARVPAWASEPHSWHQLQVNSAEDELRMQFDELVDVGREAAAAGVAAIQLVGFNDGGQDHNNPSHEPDDRLGGKAALTEAIAQVQQLGVKVVLFAKFTWADRSSPEFRSRFIADAVKDPYGDYYLHPGYRYETVTQLLDINTRRLIPMCFLAESYLAECERQFQILVDLGADGILFDESLHHLPSLLCFDEAHGHRYGAPTYANDRELIHRFAAMIPDDPEFLFAGEALYDWQFDAYALSYHRSEDRFHLPFQRYVRPAGLFMTAVTGFDDRNMVNQCLLYRYVVSYEPFNFKGRLTDFPDTVDYGQRMQALRAETRAWTWDGEFHDTMGATVVGSESEDHHPFAVFRHADGSAAVVVANYDLTPQRLHVSINGHDGELFARAVDGDSWCPLIDGALEVEPRSAVIVLPRIPMESETT